MRLARRAVLAALAATLLLALPTLAHAATYCVNAPGCTGTNEPDLQTALNAAGASSTEADIVQVGNPGPPPGSGYTFSDGGHATNQVSIIGAGPASTVLTNPGSTVLFVGGPGSTVSNLTVELPAASATGIATSGSLNNVNVMSLDPGSNSQIAADFLGSGDEHWIGGTATLPSGSGSHIGIVESSGGSLDLEDLSVRADSQGIVGTAGGTVTVHRVSLVSSAGVVAEGAHMILDDLAFRSPAAPGLFLIAQVSGSADALVDANHVSAFGDGSSSSAGLLASANGGHSATIDMRNSIVRNFAFLVERSANGSGSSANVNVAYSDIGLLHRSESNFSGGTGSVTAGAGLIDSDPLWANPAIGDFSLNPGSPARDSGDPVGLLAGDAATDLLGAPRISNGRQDMGAVEFQVPPPLPPAPPSKPRLAPAITISTLPKSLKLKRLLAGITFTVTPSEPSAIDATLAGSARSVKLAKSFNLTVAHRRLGLAGGKRRVTLKVSKKLIGHSRKFSLRLTIVATNDAGKSSTLRRTIKVRK
jgi:hypothetical protein